MGLHLRNTCTNTSQGSPLPEELLEYVNKEPYLILDCRTACSQKTIRACAKKVTASLNHVYPDLEVAVLSDICDLYSQDLPKVVSEFSRFLSSSRMFLNSSRRQCRCQRYRQQMQPVFLLSEIDACHLLLSLQEERTAAFYISLVPCFFFPKICYCIKKLS